MTKYLLVLLLFFCSYIANAQQDYSYIFDIQGLDVTVNQIYDYQGYSVVVHKYSVPLSEDICKDAKKKNGIKRKSTSIKIEGFESFPFIYSRIRQLDSGFNHVTTVFLQDEDNNALYISFTGMAFDTILYRNFLRAYANGMLSHGLFLDNSLADSIYFLDRKIILGPACKYQNPRSVQCIDRGQINWSVHTSLAHAKQTAQFQYNFTKSLKGKIVSEEVVPVLFEGERTAAKKVIWKVGGVSGYLAKELDGSNQLVVYYLALPLKGKFVHVVMSHWTNDQILENGLPPLLAEFMKLEE